MLARDKHRSLLRRSVNYSRNKFYETGPRRTLMKGNKIGRSIKFLQSDIFPFVTLSQKAKTILLLNFQPRNSYENKS